jgi:hypothetical protein
MSECAVTDCDCEPPTTGWSGYQISFRAPQVAQSSLRQARRRYTKAQCQVSFTPPPPFSPLSRDLSLVSAILRYQACLYRRIPPLYILLKRVDKSSKL